MASSLPNFGELISYRLEFGLGTKGKDRGRTEKGDVGTSATLAQTFVPEPSTSRTQIHGYMCLVNFLRSIDLSYIIKWGYVNTQI